VRKCSANTDPPQKNRLSLRRAVSLCTRPNAARPMLLTLMPSEINYTKLLVGVINVRFWTKGTPSVADL
jgi:hypothetical protein